MSDKEAILVGWVNHGRVATCGETRKNQIIAERMQQLGWKVSVMDFYRWRKHPWVFAKLAIALLLNPKATLILSSSCKNIYPFMRLHSLLRSKRPVIHWAIGGKVHEHIANGRFKARYFKALTANLVESPVMKQVMEQNGIDNVTVVPNFKPINYRPDINKPSDTDGITRFVFVSRIMPDKGCDLICQAAKTLNSEGLGDKFTIDFYGRIDEPYRQSFMEHVDALPNVSYKGFLDLSRNEGYDTLARYDAMLFPTYWRGEGFAGIFIDAFIAGTPLLASDWGHNRTLLADGETAVIYPPHSAQALTDAMRDCINGKTDLKLMAANCREQARKFDSREVITQQMLKQCGFPC